MHRTWIAVLDATRARPFAYDRTSEIGGVTEHLTEERDLINPVRHRRTSELFSDTRSGTGRTGGLHYGLPARPRLA